MSDQILYNVRKWLNPLTSTYTGNIIIKRTLGYEEDLVVELSDCNKKVRIHNAPLKPTASKQERKKNVIAYLKKLRIVIEELQAFENHLLKTLD